MKYRLNAYFAILVVTVIGAGASLLIIKVANQSNFESAESARGTASYIDAIP